jgi:hypothetical protein
VALRRLQGLACPVQVQQPVGTTTVGAHQLILVVAVQVEDKMSTVGMLISKFDTPITRLYFL